MMNSKFQASTDNVDPAVLICQPDAGSTRSIQLNQEQPRAQRTAIRKPIFNTAIGRAFFRYTEWRSSLDK